MKNYRHLLSTVGFVLIFLLGGFVLVSVLPIPGAWRILSVLSGSMEPTLHTGSVVIIQPANSYEIGDVITFQQASTDSKNAGSITHRIIKKQRVNGTDIFQTKGDANNATDVLPISQGNILGKVKGTIPLLGYVLEFLRNPVGLIIFVIIPSTLIISEEAKKIWKEVTRIRTERRERKASLEKPQAEAPGEEPVPVVAEPPTKKKAKAPAPKAKAAKKAAKKATTKPTKPSKQTSP